MTGTHHNTHTTCAHLSRHVESEVNRATTAITVYRLQPWYTRWAYLAWDTIRWMVGR